MGKNRVKGLIPGSHEFATITLFEDFTDEDCGKEDVAAQFGELHVVLAPQQAEEFAELKLQVSAHEGQLEEIRQKVSQIIDASASPSYFDVSEALETVKQLTERIFATQGEYRNGEDCEIPGDRYIEVLVADRGSLDDILARLDEWHRQVAQLPSNVKRLFRLSVDDQTE